MASKIFKIIIAVLVLAAIGGAVYYFGYKKDGVATVTGLVSSNTGASTGLQNSAIGEGSTGSQVVAILRNLSAIKLDDSVFRNPAFALLTDISISLPPVTNQGRRNPFAPVGAADTTTTTPGTGTVPTGGPSF